MASEETPISADALDQSISVSQHESHPKIVSSGNVKSGTKHTTMTEKVSTSQPRDKSEGIYATDTSWAAYRVFIAIAFSEALLFGISLSFGVFQDYYSNQALFPNHNLASWIGVLSTGIPYLGTPFVTYLCESLSIKPHYYVVSGWALTFIGLLSSAFCQDVKPLIVTQGLLYGLGVLFVEMPSLIIMNTWFVKRRGLFFGILCGLLDLFGVAWGFLASAMLNKHGLKTTCLTMAAIAFLIPGLCIFLIRERPVNTSFSSSSDSQDGHLASEFIQAEDTTKSKPFRRYYRRPTFYLLLAANLLQALAFYLPFIYLPSFTTLLGYSTSMGATVLAVANIAQIFGEVTFGRLSDKFNVHTLALVSAVVACLSTFVLWNFANSLSYVIVYAFLFGAFGSGFIALWPRMGTMFAEKDANMIYSFLSCGRGLGAIASGPISSALLRINTDQHNISAGQKYRAVILFVGSCMVVSACLGCIGWVASLYKKRLTALQKGEHV